MRISGFVLVAITAVAACVAIDALLHVASAQNPFGGPRPASLPREGFFGWLIAMQSEFYREISSSLKAAKNDGTAVWTLLGVSFAYGVFHAAGPGHGKAVISSYLVANDETIKRGVALSFVSAILQAAVAVLLVGIGAFVLNATAQSMCGAERVIEIASYGLIAAFGTRLVWSKGAGFIAALQMGRTAGALSLANAHAQGHNHTSTHAHGHAHSHAHVHNEHCGHSHGPMPQDLEGRGWWRRGLGAVVAVGLRPCSGAILVLVFALAQGLFWAGIAATFLMGLGTAITVSVIAVMALSAKKLAARLASGKNGGVMLAMRGIEFAAAGLVMLFGVGLLLGYLAAERVTCL